MEEYNTDGCVTTNENPDGYHEPDWESAQATVKEGALFLVVLCPHCNKEGLIRLNSSLVDLVEW